MSCTSKYEITYSTYADAMEFQRRGGVNALLLFHAFKPTHIQRIETDKRGRRLTAESVSRESLRCDAHLFLDNKWWLEESHAIIVAARFLHVIAFKRQFLVDFVALLFVIAKVSMSAQSGRGLLLSLIHI